MLLIFLDKVFQKFKNSLSVILYLGNLTFL